MRVDGKAIAEKFKRDFAALLKSKGTMPLRLAVFAVDPNLATQKFISVKQDFAAAVGIDLVSLELPATITTDELRMRVEESIATHDGIVVQFPLPRHIDRDVVRDAIPFSHDVDMISSPAQERFKAGTTSLLPPVVAALDEIVRRFDIELAGKFVAIVGEGHLVGRPAFVWANRNGARVQTLNAKTSALQATIATADVLVLGAGVPGLIKPEMVKPGVVILDAGTSEVFGKLQGDADPACEAKASIFTPVPGGIGPITVAMLFRNLIELSEKKDA